MAVRACEKFSDQKALKILWQLFALNSNYKWKSANPQGITYGLL